MVKNLPFHESGQPHVFNGTADITFQGRALDCVCLICGLRGTVSPDGKTVAAEGHPDKVSLCYRAELPRPSEVVVTDGRPYGGGYLHPGPGYLTTGTEMAPPLFAGLYVFLKPGSPAGPSIHLTPDEYLDPNDFTDALPATIDPNPETHPAHALPSVNA